jgi:hypothetical protein
LITIRAFHRASASVWRSGAIYRQTFWLAVALLAFSILAASCGEAAGAALSSPVVRIAGDGSQALSPQPGSLPGQVSDHPPASLISGAAPSDEQTHGKVLKEKPRLHLRSFRTHECLLRVGSPDTPFPSTSPAKLCNGPLYAFLSFYLI